METTFGTLEPPLGKLRITIASLVATAVAANTKLINEALANTEIIKTLLVSLYLEACQDLLRSFFANIVPSCV